MALMNDYIAEHCEPGDVVVSADILLADRIVAKGVALITPKGEEPRCGQHR